MCLIEKIRSIEHKYRRFLEKKLYVYKMWQSFDYFNHLYLTLYDETCKDFIAVVLAEERILSVEGKVTKLLERFLDQLVRLYEKCLQQDFEKSVYFEEYTMRVME